jgi:type I restriction enzyme S subunit
MKVPAIRFKGFSDEWEGSELGGLIEITSASRVHKNEWTESGVPFFRSSDVVANYKGLVNEKAFISYELYKELSDKSGCVKKNDLLVTGGGSIGIPYLIKTNEPLYFKDADLLWLKNGDKLNGYFLYTFFSTLSFRRYVNSITHIGTISHYTVIQAKSTPIDIPDKDEQDEIGEFLLNLDKLISLQQAKVNKLTNLKKAMLEKMFPKQGADVPEIRFKGFVGAWRVNSLGDICDDTFGGGTPKTSQESYWDGDTPWIQSSDLIEGELTNVTPKKYVTQAGIKGSATKLIPNNSIAIVTRVGIGKLALMPFAYTTSQDFLSLSGLKIDKRFAVYAIWKKIQEDLHIVQGTSIKGITKEEALTKVINVPTEFDEQNKIGDYFQNLDKIITLHQTELEKLSHLKKACLEKMFV